MKFTTLFNRLMLGLVVTGMMAPGLVQAIGPKAGQSKAKGGISKVVLPSQSPLITIRVMFRAGSAYDPPGKEGIAKLTASLIEEGGSQSLTYKDILKKLYPMAADVSVKVEKETVTMVGEVHKDHLDKFYAIFSDVLLHPRFDQAEFDRVREDAVNYLKTSLRSTNDEEFGKQTLETEIFRGHAYDHVIGGSVRSLNALKLEDVKAFYQEYYTQSNLMVGVAGDVPKTFVAQMEKDFSALPVGKPAELRAGTITPPSGLEVTLIEKDTDATAISLGFPINVTRKDSEFYALLVANSYLGEHRTFNGVLMQNMRGKRGLNYGDYSYAEHFVQEGGSTFALPNVPRQKQYFSIWIRPVPNAARLFALREAMWETDRLVKNGMTQEQFESTRKFLLNYSRLWVQTLSRRLGYRMDSKFYGIEDYIQEIQTRLPKLTLAEVNAAIKKHLNSQSFKVVMITRDAESLKQQMLANTVSPMKYDSATPDDILKEDKEIEKFPLAATEKKIRIVKAEDMFE